MLAKALPSFVNNACFEGNSVKIWNKVTEMRGEQLMCQNHSVMILVLFEVFKVSLWQSGDNTGKMGPVGQQL